jgi:hypothetical protein
MWSFPVTIGVQRVHLRYRITAVSNFLLSVRQALNISKTTCNFLDHVHCRFQLDLDAIPSVTHTEDTCNSLRKSARHGNKAKGSSFKSKTAGCWNMFFYCLTTIWGVITVLSLTTKPQIWVRAVVICHLVFAWLPSYCRVHTFRQLWATLSEACYALSSSKRAHHNHDNFRYLLFNLFSNIYINAQITKEKTAAVVTYCPWIVKTCSEITCITDRKGNASQLNEIS